MKRMMILLILFSMFLIEIGFSQEQQEQVIREGNDVVVYEQVKTEKERYQAPQGIPPDIALAIIREERQQYVSEGEGKSKFTFSFPMNKETCSENEIFTYEQGEWERKLELISQKTSDWALTVFCLIFPIIGILIVSLFNQLKKIGSKKLLIFYGAILVTMVITGVVGVVLGSNTGMLIGTFAGGLAGGLAGGFTGGLAGWFAGGTASGITGVFTSMFVGGFASGLTGIFAGVFASQNNLETVEAYFIFIICVCLVSFLLAKLLSKLADKSKKTLKNPTY